ncbi:cytochrome P450 [Streptomyces sp. NPDC059215]|uniref:cytochrome P450 family protein n=1 Tax=Streptomyces sp. NPDC059215 TaxID=3346772 RepID=UPI0036AC4E4B
MTTTDHDDFTVMDAAFKADAHARYAELRARGPVHKAQILRGLDTWVVVDHDLAKIALTHPALLKDATPAADALEAVGFTAHRPESGLGANMLNADPPDHTRLRGLVAAAFTRPRIEALRPRVAEIAEGLADAMAPLGAADLVRSFTGPLPVQVISELLGVPEEGRASFRAWTSQALGSKAEKQREAFVSLNGYLAELVAEKQRSPGDDLLSALTAVHDQRDGRLSMAELVGTANLLVVAGHDTTVNLLGNAMVALLHRPEQARRLRERPELLPGAVEELLRFDPPVEFTPMRYAAEDITLGGARIPRGGTVVVALTSVGRADPAVAAAERDVLDVGRPDVRHLSFGHGIHHCLGAPLARLEAEVGIGTLLRRFPDLATAVRPDDVPWIPVGLMRGPVSLPVTFTPVPATA